MPILIALFAVFCAAVSSAQDEPIIVSSRDLFGPPDKMDESEPLRVQMNETCRGRIELGEAEFSEPKGLQTVRIPIHSVTDIPVKFVVETAFIKSDGSVVRSPYPKQTGGFEGMARGFVGLISLGASEAQILKESSVTIITRHQVLPGESLVVEHQLPYQSENVVGSRSFVSIDSTKSKLAHENTVRRSLDAQFWEVRERYHEARKAENALWDQLRQKLQVEKENFPPLSEKYRELMDRYWDEHRSHLDRLEEIEAKFKEFEEDQRLRLNDQLKQ